MSYTINLYIDWDTVILKWNEIVFKYKNIYTYKKFNNKDNLQ